METIELVLNPKAGATITLTDKNRLETLVAMLAAVGVNFTEKASEDGKITFTLEEDPDHEGVDEDTTYVSDDGDDLDE